MNKCLKCDTLYPLYVKDGCPTCRLGIIEPSKEIGPVEMRLFLNQSETLARKQIEVLRAIEANTQVIMKSFVPAYGGQFPDALKSLVKVLCLKNGIDSYQAL